MPGQLLSHHDLLDVFLGLDGSLLISVLFFQLYRSKLQISSWILPTCCFRDELLAHKSSISILIVAISWLISWFSALELSTLSERNCIDDHMSHISDLKDLNPTNMSFLKSSRTCTRNSLVIFVLAREVMNNEAIISGVHIGLNSKYIVV